MAQTDSSVRLDEVDVDTGTKDETAPTPYRRGGPRGRQFLALCLVPIALVVAAFEFAIPEGDAFGQTLRWLSGAIFALVAWAYWHGWKYLRGLWVEYDFARYTNNALVQAKVRSQHPSVAPVSFQGLRDMLPPPPAGQSDPEILKVSLRMLRDAEDHIYEHRDALLRSYREEIGADLEAVEDIQVTSLRFGILGTFVGLVLALKSMAQDTFSGPGTSPAELSGTAGNDDFLRFSNELLTALGVSFGTSVAGLVVAASITFLIMFARKQRNDLFAVADDMVSSLLSLARRATYQQKGLLSSFAQMQGSMERVERKMQDEVRTASLHLNEAGERILAQTEAIQTGLEKLGEVQTHWGDFLTSLKAGHDASLALSSEQREAAQESFAGFLDKLESRESQFIGDFAETLDALSVEKLSRGINDSAKTAFDDLSEQLSEDAGQLRSELVANTKAQAALADEVLRSSEQLSSFVNRMSDVQPLAGALEETSDALLSSMVDLTESQKDLREGVLDAVDSLNKPGLEREKAAQADRESMLAVHREIASLKTEAVELEKTITSLSDVVLSTKSLFENRLRGIWRPFVVGAAFAAGATAIGSAVIWAWLVLA